MPLSVRGGLLVPNEIMCSLFSLLFIFILVFISRQCFSAGEEFEYTNRLVIGHNVSFDRAYVREEYQLAVGPGGEYQEWAPGMGGGVHCKGHSNKPTYSGTGLVSHFSVNIYN